MVALQDELVLPCGSKLRNRLCKSAMTEGLGDPLGRATQGHVNLYRAWAESECGLLITGNVQVDRRYLERPGNVCIDGQQDQEQLARLKEYAQAATSTGHHCWVQLGHAGRQSSVNVSPIALAPSSKDVTMPIPMPKAREMTLSEIEELKTRFAHAAAVCKQAGFTGCQIHGAHGYLLSSFLNPLANVRGDQYGGSLANRASLLLQVVDAVRAAVGPDFPIGVKLNSSDFQTGGFAHEEAIQVARWLDEHGIDLLELSGGNYESPRLMGFGHKESTKKREAYFLQYAKDIAGVLKRTPLMVTGGFRSRECMEHALTSEKVDVIGLGRPLCIDPRCTKPLLEGAIDELPAPERSIPTPGLLQWLTTLPGGHFKALGVGAVQAVYYGQFWEWGAARSPERVTKSPNVLLAMLYWQLKDAWMAFCLKNVPALPAQDLETLRRERLKKWALWSTVLVLLFAWWKK